MQALAAVSQMMAMQGAQAMPVMGPGTPSAPLQRDFNSMHSLHSMDSGGSEAGLRSPQLSGGGAADSIIPHEGELELRSACPEQDKDREQDACVHMNELVPFWRAQVDILAWPGLHVMIDAQSAVV